MAYPKSHDWTREEIKNDNMLVVAFLTSSYIYYHKPHMRPICSDVTFDWICRELLAKYDTIEHNELHLISKEDLKAGSGFALRESDYGSQCKAAALSMSNLKLTLSCGRIVE